MRRFVSIILAAAMLLTASLTGCAKQESASSQAQASSAETASAKTLEPATLQVWLLGPGKQADADAVWEKFNTKLKETLPNTTVEFTVYTGAEYKDKFNNMLAAGEKVDLAWVGYATNLLTDEKDGNLMPLDDLLNQYGSGIKDFLGDTVIDLHRYSDGKLYYILNWQSLFGGRNAIQVPTSLAKLAGDNWVTEANKVASTMINQPSIENVTAMYQKMAQYYQALKDNNKLYGGMGKYTFTFDTIWEWGSRILGQNGIGVHYGDDTFKVSTMFDSEYFRLFASTMADFYKKGYIASDIASKEYGVWTDNKNGSFDVNDYISWCHNAFSDDSATMYTAKYNTDTSLIRLHDKGVLTLGSVTAMSIPYCSDEPERAMMLLNELWTNKELYQLLIYGEKGVHYTDNGDGTVTTPYGMQGTINNSYGLWNWSIGNCMNALTTQADVKGYYTELKTKEATAYISPLLNFTFDPTPVRDIITALDAISKEYYDTLRYGYAGDQWEDVYNKFKSESKAAGIDQLAAEYQKQLDAYRAKNNITKWNYNNE